ncbi:hypothetical protein HHI36_020987 [Cryptolaemus montrouzieri]|uniref:Uncharacterized protein n=1 Tax=Cryptolaemus montrouzieri TaxID=559131 RepID=A0ABD2MWD6_9CUCU
MGYALGELACAYFDNSLTLEQVVLVSYEIGHHLEEVNKPSSVYVVNLGEGQVRKLLPPNVEIIWKNSVNTVTLSGEPKAAQAFISVLEKEGVRVTEIASVDVTLHSKRIATIESTLLPKLKKIIPSPKQRNTQWLSASTERVSSPEYFVKALHSQVYFQDLTSHVANAQVVMEIGSGTFSELLKCTLDKQVECIKFDKNPKKSGVITLLEVLGNLYEYGFNPQIQNLYPKLQYPVSRGTPMISPKIKWDHSKNWHVIFYKESDSLKSGERMLGVTLKQEEWQYIGGHVVDGRNLFPATGYLHAVWDTLAITTSVLDTEMIIVFENCRFNRATTVGRDVTEFNIMIQRASGNFEVIEGGTDVVSGRIYTVTEDQLEQVELPLPAESSKYGVYPLKTKDVYKELRLRGYNYKGAFRGIQECDSSATKAWIKWDGNWVSFMDTMLQIKILQMDSRLLYVPRSIKKLTIDAKKHLQYVESFGENPILPVYVYKDSGIIKCGGIEIRGLLASSIARRKQRGQPVLEKYEFVPNEIDVPLVSSLRVNMQIGLENLYAIKLKVVELIDEATREDSEPLGPMIYEVFGDQPLIQTNIIILSKDKLDLPNVTVEDKKLVSENDCNLVVGSKLLQRVMVLQQAFGALKEKGFALSREDLNFKLSSFTEEDLSGIDILTVHNTGTEKLVYFRKSMEMKEVSVINVSETDEEFTWLPSLQTALKNDTHVIIYAQNEETSGILGLFNCIRREPGGMNVRCFLIYGADAPPFDPKHPFYAKQVSKNMSVNIYKNGRWGTYRHLLMSELEEINSEHCFVNALIRGDMSSLKWIEGGLKSDSILPPEKILVRVYFASLNFRDVMTASGRINADVITMDRTEQECVQGFEFSGRDGSGRRVMGMVVHGALTTLLAADNYLLWEIPDCWTMEQAATIPVVYGTVLYALAERGNMKRGDSVLIHSGTGGVGQAAISIALAYGCTVYTTVGTPEKREFIKKLFPQLTDRHIGSSRDITFEKLIMRETKGRGVDMVLNSWQRRNCRLLSECSFHGVMLDQLFTSHPSIKQKIGNMLVDGIKSGAVRPLTTNVFPMNEIEQAFRFMASGKHMGKVMIQIRKEECDRNCVTPIELYKAIPRYSCSTNRSYIIVGGLGGFGLELADWLVLRGARKLVLTSRTGVQTGYQSYRLKIWRSYGTLIKISTADITTREGCEQLISEAEEFDPVESIFNLAVVLKDSLLENQSPESFRISFGPKAVATRYLDEITRQRCPELRDFVIFSSVSCGRGNAGQTNYGMANSIMERICENRRRDGYPALAVEWGAVGDVGLVAELMEEHTEMEIGGTLQQRISNCLQVMDTFLRQKQATIVSSMVVAEKRSGTGGADNIVDAVANILGIKKQQVSPHATLAELGMDSMTAVEIKQTLEREFEVFLTAQDIRSMTFARLQEIQQSKESDREAGIVHQRLPTGIELILRYLGDEATSTIPIIRLPSLVEDDSDAPYVFCFPGIEGFATTLKPMVANIRAKTIGIQFCYKNPTNTYKDLAMESVVQIEKFVKLNDPIHIVAYSWGTIIGLETMALLEKKGYKGTMTCIDGAPDMLMEMCKQEMRSGSDAEFETVILCHLMALYLPYEIILKNREKLYKCNTFEERLEVAQQIASTDSTHSPQYQRKVCIAFHTRIKELKTYEPDYSKVQSVVRLFKPSTLSVLNISDDYKLSNLCANVQEVRVFEGNHMTILENLEVAEAINGILGVKKAATVPTEIESTDIHVKQALVDVTKTSEIEVKHI